MLITNIAYGPTHAHEVKAYLGVSLRDCRNTENCIYLRPHYAVYELPDGRVAKVIDDGINLSKILLFADRAEYGNYRDASWAAMPDPETGRVRTAK